MKNNSNGYEFLVIIYVYICTYIYTYMYKRQEINNRWKLRVSIANRLKQYSVEIRCQKS